jgi:hypothetical protein
MANEPRSFWWAIASCVLMLLGGFGPWARIFGVISVNGTDGDGWIVIIAAVIAAGLIVLRQRRALGRWPLIIALLAAVIAAATAIYDWTDLNRVADQLGIIHAGWGIYVSTIGSCSLVLACIGLLLERPRPAREVAPAAPQSD